MRGARRLSLLTLTVTSSLASGAWAQGAPADAPSDAPSGAPSEGGATTTAEPTASAPAVPSPSAVADERFEELKAQNEELREELELLKEDYTYLEQKVEKLAPIAAKVTGFLDVGFFSVGGDGTGIRPDFGHAHFPELADVPDLDDHWVFMGDPLSTAVNARGEPATTGDSRAVTLDAIKGRKSSFLINTLNVGLFAEVGKNTLFTAKVDFLPRGRDVSVVDGLFLGDYVDVRLAYMEHRIERPWMKLDLYAGKFDSVIGFEYRSQEAPSRIEVTPSLICRYTCGYPIGLKARARWFDDDLILNVSVTNGSHFSEGFPLYNETDTNHLKTAAGRLSYQILRGLEVGASGMFGAQDNQAHEDIYQWLFAFDLHYHRDNFVFRAEYVQGRAEGRDDPAIEAKCADVPCLDFRGMYGLLGIRLTNVVMPYLRIDWRDALHEAGTSFIYISELIRATPGIRLDLNENLIFKAEYTVNRELGRIPQFPNDVFTSAFVVKY